MGNKFVIKTDHVALEHLMEKKLTTMLEHKWLLKFLGYDYILIYKKGEDNLMADALSRCNDSKGHYNALHTYNPLWKHEIHQIWEGDDVVKYLMLSLAVHYKNDMGVSNGGW